MVEDAAVSTDPMVDPAAVYRPLRPGGAGSIFLALRLTPEPATFVLTLRAAALAVDPAMRLHEVRSLRSVGDADRRVGEFFALAYAAVALVAGPRQILAAIVSRTLAQVGLGIVVGTVLAAQLSREALSNGILGPIAVLMMVVGLLACALPARRALSIQPTEALK